MVLRQSSRTALITLGLLLLVPAPAYAQGLGLPGPGGCYEDAYEPNPYSAPTLLTESVVLSDTNICAGDDWYRVDLQAGQVVTFELDFFHADGDVDMTLHRADDYVQFDISEGAVDREFLRYVAFEDTSILLRVYGYSGATNNYALSFELADYSRTCEWNAAPVRLALGGVYSGAVCLGRSAEFHLDVDDDEPFEVTLVTDPSMGDLDLVVLDEDGRREAVSASRGPWERVRVFPRDDGLRRIRVSEYGDAFGPIRLSVVPLDLDSSPLEIEGRLEYERLVPTERGLKGRDVVSPEGVVVEVVRLLDDFPIARATTDSDGRYRFQINYIRAESLVLRVSARLETPTYRLRVIPTVDATTPHGLDSAPLSTYPLSDDRLELDLTLGVDDVLTGALNIAVVAREALELIQTVARRPLLEVTFVWDQGRSHPCGSCYSDGNILLAGGSEDTDEFDDAVIVHELGHFIVDKLSWDDSPGGSHDGSRTDPLIAYGEGIATALAVIVLGSPFYIDTGPAGVLAHEDIELVPFPAAYGTSDRTLTGVVSEWMTAALLWDFYDAASDDEPFDRVELSAVSMLRVLFGPLTDRRRADLGAFGMELADVVNAFRCSFPAAAPAVEQLVRGHQRFPIELAGKMKCEWSAVQ